MAHEAETQVANMEKVVLGVFQENPKIAFSVSEVIEFFKRIGEVGVIVPIILGRLQRSGNLQVINQKYQLSGSVLQSQSRGTN